MSLDPCADPACLPSGISRNIKSDYSSPGLSAPFYPYWIITGPDTYTVTVEDPRGWDSSMAEAPYPMITVVIPSDAPSGYYEANYQIRVGAAYVHKAFCVCNGSNPPPPPTGPGTNCGS